MFAYFIVDLKQLGFIIYTNMYQVERQTAGGKYWYEVMLSPFKTLKEVKEYLDKYSCYYPNPEDKKYKVTQLNLDLQN